MTPTPHRYAAAFANEDVGWFSFLAMARAEFLAPLAAIGLAAAVLVVVLVLGLAELRAWVFFTPLLAFMGATFWGWLAANRRLQALEDLPLSRIGSAAQGYVRLEGRAASFPGHPTRSPLTQLVCCWYSYRIVECDDRGRPKSHEEDTSAWSFTMSDGSGECVVDPAGARIVPVRTQRWRERNFHYVEKTILPQDPIVVMGQFSSSAAGATDHDIETRVGELVTAWKKDMPSLVQRFDLNGDAELSVEEFEQVRAAALAEVRAELAHNPPRAQNLVARPADGRPFIISAESAPRLERDLKIWAWLHLALFLAGGGAFAYWTIALRA